MRLLRHTAAPLFLSLLVAPLACTTIIQQPPEEDSSSGQESSTTSDDTTTTSDDTTSTTSDDTTTSGLDTGTETAGESTDTGSNGQACGNGVIEGTEQCDCGGMPCSPAGLGGAMCTGLPNPAFPDRYYTGGILDCNPASCQFSFGSCSYCGDEILNGMELCEEDDNGPSCQDLGMGSSTQDLPCGPTCLQWYVECCGDEPPEDCD